jgi:hypothetical protein
MLLPRQSPYFAAPVGLTSRENGAAPNIGMHRRPVQERGLRAYYYKSRPVYIGRSPCAYDGASSRDQRGGKRSAWSFRRR